MWQLSLVLYDFSHFHKVKQRLLELGVEGLYHIKEGEIWSVGGCLKERRDEELESLSQWGRWELTSFSIDWKKEWQQEEVVFALKDQLSIKLLPGPGFGDTTHPSSRLILTLIYKHIQGVRVLDLGCGSGILSCSALRYGASEVYSIDVDPEALKHCEANLFHNGFIPGDFFVLNKLVDPELFLGSVMLINMIEQEQKQVFDSYLPCLDLLQQVFVSGILKERKDVYEKELFYSYFKKEMWERVEEKSEGIWWAGHYKKKAQVT